MMHHAPHRAADVPMPHPVLLPLMLFAYALAIALWIAAAQAQTVGTGGVGYLAGGVGSDEMARMKAHHAPEQPAARDGPGSS